MLAVQLGSEVGLRPMQALQNIAVINGRPAVWGDALMDAKRAGLWTKAGPWQTYPRRMLQMRARSFALRDAFPDVLKGLISVEEALDNHSGADQLAPPTIDAIAEPATPPPAPPRAYQLTTKQGTTTFQTGAEWLSAWAKLVRGCKAARALDKLQTERQTNQAHIAAVAAFDPEPAATSLQPLPHRVVVDLDIHDRSQRNLMLADRFLRGVREAGISVGQDANVLLHVNTSRLGETSPGATRGAERTYSELGGLAG